MKNKKKKLAVFILAMSLMLGFKFLDVKLNISDNEKLVDLDKIMRPGDIISLNIDEPEIIEEETASEEIAAVIEEEPEQEESAEIINPVNSTSTASTYEYTKKVEFSIKGKDVYEGDQLCIGEPYNSRIKRYHEQGYEITITDDFAEYYKMKEVYDFLEENHIDYVPSREDE